MATIFVSYSHSDVDFVALMVAAIKENGHSVEVDEKFLHGGDLLTSAIKDKIRRSDFTVVLLSSQSVQSEWVSREICEVVHMEHETNTAKLVPCRMGEMRDSALPEILTRYPAHEPLYIDYRDKGPPQDFFEKLVRRLDEQGGSKFKRGAHMTLKIGERGLGIYLTGPGLGWGRNSMLRYFETLEGYLLLGFTKNSIGRHFKHFVACDEADGNQQRKIKEVLENAGYAVTGDGGYDDEPGRWRIYFLRRDYPATKGYAEPFSNNYW